MNIRKTLQIGNILFFFATIFINYISNTGAINNTTIGKISGNFKTLFTPAGYAFAIWGLIYLLLLGFIVYQSRSLFIKVKDDSFIMKTGIWFMITCIANSAWVLSWLYGYTGFSVICMSILLLALLKVILNNDMELWDAPINTVAFLWWPFVVYSGWVTVASIANISAYLTKMQWDGWGISPEAWTVIMIVIAALINIIITWSRNMREFALVGAWALVAIAVANWNNHQAIVYPAILAALILVISSGLHAYKNKATNPFIKLHQYIKK